MKEKLTRNIGLKILSIILAGILWLVITNIDDPIAQHKFHNVPVEVLNAEAITSQGKLYDILEGETVDFTVEARRSIADNLTVNDFRVTADFEHLSDVNAVTIDITCPGYGDEVVTTEGKYQTMKVSLEPYSEKSFKVDIKQKGDVAEGYFIEEKTASPNMIKVSGPKSRVDRITDLVVEADVTGAKGSFHITGVPKVLDADGVEIDVSNLTFSDNYITVNIGLYKTKTINLQITATGEPAKGYIMTNVEYEPKTIEVAGDDAALNKIKFVSLTESITGATENIEKEINLQDRLPVGIELVGEDQTAVINITIEKSETKALTIWPRDLEQRNKSEALILTYSSTLPITINVAGPIGVIADISGTSIKPYLNLLNYSVGTYTLEIGFNLPDHVSILSNPMVNFNLKQ